MINFFLSILVVLPLILIIITGVYHFKNREYPRYSYLLTIMGTISIVWTFCIPNLLTALSYAPDMTIELIDALIFYLLFITTSILSIITFGGVFIFIGIKNERIFGNYLTNSGILWVLSGLLSLFGTIGLDGNRYVDYIPPPDDNFIIALRIINYVSMAIGILARVFLLMYAMKVINSLLGIAALLLIIGTLIALILEIYFSSIIY